MQENHFMGGWPHVGSLVDILEVWGLSDSIVGLFDTTRTVQQDEWQGVRVVMQQDVVDMSHDNHVIIACAGLNELYGSIIPEHLFYFRIFHRRALEACFELPALMDDIQGAVDLLSDDLSKQVYLNRLDFILSSVMFCESFKTPGGPYFQNDLVSHLGARWLYAGAYNGKHLIRAMSFCADQQMVAVEPSARMYQFLQDNFGDKPNCDLQNYLLWSESGRDIRFTDDSTIRVWRPPHLFPRNLGRQERLKP